MGLLVSLFSLAAIAAGALLLLVKLPNALSRPGLLRTHALSSSLKGSDSKRRVKWWSILSVFDHAEETDAAADAQAAAGSDSHVTVVDLASRLSPKRAGYGRDGARGLLPVIPVGAVLREVPFTPLHAPIQPHDVTVMDAFIRGECLHVILSQGRTINGLVSGFKDYHGALGLYVVPPRPVSADAADSLMTPRARAEIPLAISAVYSTEYWEQQASAAVVACDSSLLRDVQQADIVVRYSTHVPARVTAPRAEAQPGQGPPDFAVCAMIKATSAAHLAVWIEYHASIGFDHAYIYINEPWDDFLERAAGSPLEKLWWSGAVTFIAWDYPRWFPGDGLAGHFAQTGAANDCHRRFGGDSTTFAFLDVDEFVYVGRGTIQQAMAPNETCVLLAATWAVGGSIPDMSLSGFLSTDLLTLGPLIKLRGDPHALYRHKLLAKAKGLGIVGVHGTLRPQQASGRMSAEQPPCVFMWDKNGTGAPAADPDTIGYLHVISPSMQSARPRPDDLSVSRVASIIADEIQTSPAARVFQLHRTAVEVGGATLSRFHPGVLLAGMVHPIPHARFTQAAHHVATEQATLAAAEVVDAFIKGDCMTLLLIWTRDPEPAGESENSAAAAHDSELAPFVITVPALNSRAKSLPLMRKGTVHSWQGRCAAYFDACASEIGDVHEVATSVTYVVASERSANPTAHITPAVRRQYQPQWKVPTAICATMHGSIPPHFRAWVEYHLAAGIGKIIMYVGMGKRALGSHSSARFLYDHVNSGRVVLFDWSHTMLACDEAGGTACARALVASDCLVRFKDHADTIVVSDTDSFLFVPQGYALSGVLPVVNDTVPCATLPARWTLLRTPVTDSMGHDLELAALREHEMPTVGVTDAVRADNAVAAHRAVVLSTDSSHLLRTPRAQFPLHGSVCSAEHAAYAVRPDSPVMGVITVLYPDTLAPEPVYTGERPPGMYRHERGLAALTSAASPMRGYCRECVHDAPLDPQQISDTRIHEMYAEINADAESTPYFAWQRAAYLRCETAPACGQSKAQQIALNGTASRSHERHLLPYPGMPPAPLLDVPIGTRLLVQGENSRGRYSNMRHALLDFVQLALITNRTVVLAPMAHSTVQCEEEFDDLYDLPHLNQLVRVIPAPPASSGIPRHRLTQHCSGMPHASEPTMLVNMERHLKYTPRSTTIFPTWGQWKVAGGIDWNLVPYSKRTHVMPLMTELHEDTCVGVSSAFWLFPRVHSDAQRMHNALRPSRRIQRVIDGFLGDRLGNQKFLGLHMRLTDLGYATEDTCQRNMTETIAVAQRLVSEFSLHHVAVATDDARSACMRTFRSAFPSAVMVESGVFSPASCSEAQFVQEVLARGSCFVGTVNSTMSYAVRSIQPTDRAQNSAALQCTMLLAAGQVTFQW